MADVLLTQRYEAADDAAATEALRAVFGVGTMTTSAGRALDYRQHSLVDDGISVTRIASSGAAVRVESATTPDLVVVAVRDGEVEVQQDPAAAAEPGASGSAVLGRGDLGVVCRGSAARLGWDRVEMDVYSFPPASIGRLLGADEMRLNLRCTRPRAVSPAVIELWQRTAAVLVGGVLQQRELFESDLIRENAIDALLGIAVEAFGISNVSDDIGTDQQLLARADAFMRAHLADSVTVPEVARAVGVSLRGLQLLFQHRGEGTPVLHLRQLRMHAAREALSGGGRSTTVGAVARGLSYTNLGRFSAHYREAFGETPSETLRAARSSVQS